MGRSGFNSGYLKTGSSESKKAQNGRWQTSPQNTNRPFIWGFRIASPIPHPFACLECAGAAHTLPKQAVDTENTWALISAPKIELGRPWNQLLLSKSMPTPQDCALQSFQCRQRKINRISKSIQRPAEIFWLLHDPQVKGEKELVESKSLPQALLPLPPPHRQLQVTEWVSHSQLTPESMFYS